MSKLNKYYGSDYHETLKESEEIAKKLGSYAFYLKDKSLAQDLKKAAKAIRTLTPIVGEKILDDQRRWDEMSDYGG